MAKVMRFERSFAPAAAGAANERIGTDIARALDAFGDDVASAVDPMIQRREANQIRTTLAEGGDVQPSLGLTPIQRARNVVAQQGHLDRVGVNVASEVTRLHQQYSGQKLSDPADFARELDAYAKGQLDAVPEGFRGAAMQHYQQVRGDAVSRLSEASFRNEDERNLKDSAAADDLDTDLMMKAARDGNEAEANAAAERMAGRRMALIEAGIIGEDFAKADAAKLMDAAMGERLYGEVLRGGGPSLEEVEAGKGAAAALSLEARDALSRQIRGYQQHVRSEQNHAMAAQTHAVSQQTDRLEFYTQQQDHGIPLDEKQTADRDALLGTPGAVKPKAFAEGLASRETLGISRQVATATPQQIEVVRAEWAANPPKSEAEFQIRERSAKALAEREKALADDPAAYASRVMPDKFPPVILPPPSDPGFDGALAQAANNAGLIEAQFGVVASPFTKDQQQRLATTMATLTADEQANVLGRVEQAFGKGRASVVYEGFAKEGALVQADAGRLSVQGRGDLSTAILQGQQAFKAGVVTTPGKEKVNAALFASGIPAAFRTGAKAQAQLRESALALAGYRAMMAGTPEAVESFLPDALAEVQPVGQYREQTVALPPGVTDAGVFADNIEQVTETEIAKMGGNVGHLGFVADALRSGNARLQSRGEGLYSVVIGTAQAKNADGSPFILDYSQIEPKPARGLPTALPDPLVGGYDPSGR